MDFNITMTEYDVRSKAISWFLEDLPKLQKEMKKVAGLMYDNNRLKFVSTMGTLFSLSFSQMHGTKGSFNYATYSKFPGFEVVGKTKYGLLFNIYRYNLWDSVGNTHLSDGVFACDSDKPIPQNIQKEIAEAAKKFDNGIVACSDCGEEIKKAEAGGRYFAGVYCQECWDSEWKAREAKETYN